MFRFCPSCASSEITFERNKFRCPSCGFVYYHNTAAATACIIRTGGPDPSGERILFLVRGRDPGRGLLDLPGGFVDPGEGVFDGLRRELREELGWTPSGEGPDPFVLFASFPNVYPYKGITYNTCDLFFTISVPELSGKDLAVEESEIQALRFLRRSEINLADIAFESVKKALSAYERWRNQPHAGRLS